jgi:hypothetical protein
MFNVFVATLAKRYEDGKAIRVSKQAPPTLPGS